MTKEELKEYHKQYRLDNKEELKEYQKQWRLNNKEEIKEAKKQWDLDNKKEIKEASKQYRLDNKEELKERHKKYRLDNPEKCKEATRKWRLNNPEKVKESKNKYRNNRYQTDPLFKLSSNMRSRIIMFIKSSGLKKTSKSFDMIGCTPEYLKQHLEKQFVDGMTWDNHGDWHIDHIIPLASAVTPEELTKLFHYSNTQPLWAIDNLIKGDKIL